MARRGGGGAAAEAGEPLEPESPMNIRDVMRGVAADFPEDALDAERRRRSVRHATVGVGVGVGGVDDVNGRTATRRDVAAAAAARGDAAARVESLAGGGEKETYREGNGGGGADGDDDDDEAWDSWEVVHGNPKPASGSPSTPFDVLSDARTAVDERAVDAALDRSLRRRPGSGNAGIGGVSYGQTESGGGDEGDGDGGDEARRRRPMLLGGSFAESAVAVLPPAAEAPARRVLAAAHAALTRAAPAVAGWPPVVRGGVRVGDELGGWMEENVGNCLGVRYKNNRPYSC